MIKTLEERFWAKVDKRGPDDCWPWLGCLARDGYGYILTGNRESPATHVALLFAGRSKPEAPYNHALHGDQCSRSCVNPNHLRWGSNHQNTEDRERLGRNKIPDNKGQKHGMAKLTDEQVREIRSKTGISQQKIADSYGVHQVTISLIKRGKGWRHVI